MSGPLYLRGVDRAKAERISAHFLKSYQPPVSCGHRPGPVFKSVDGVRGVFRACLECGMVLGVVR